MNRLILTAALAIGLSACDGRPRLPREDYGSCLKGHVQTGFMYYPNGSGGMMLMPTSDYVCDGYEYPAGDGPKYQAQLQRYIKELAAWEKRKAGAAR